MEQAMEVLEDKKPPQENTQILIELEKAKESVRKDERNIFNLPMRFRDHSIRNFIDKNGIVENLLESIKNGGSVFLTGKCGTGKTHLACGLMREWFIFNMKIVTEITPNLNSYNPRTASTYNETEQEVISYPRKPILIPAVELFLELKSSFDNKEISEDDILTKYSSIPMLVIDDVGVEKVSDWSRQVFYTIIDRRYRDIKQTIITSNLNLEELSKAIDDRIASRIVEMGQVINLGDKDMRLTKRNK